MQNAFWQSGCDSIWFLNKKQIEKKLNGTRGPFPPLTANVIKKHFFLEHFPYDAA